MVAKLNNSLQRVILTRNQKNCLTWMELAFVVDELKLLLNFEMISRYIYVCVYIYIYIYKKKSANVL